MALGFLPESLRNPLRSLYLRARPYLPGEAALRAGIEVSNFANGKRREFYLAAAHFLKVNRTPELTSGYYFEFGSHEANTMRLAWDTMGDLFQLHHVAFDSFEGLPEITEIDRLPIWEKGKLRTAEEAFLSVCRRHGVRRLRTVKGFYSESLTGELRRSLDGHKATLVYIDCDLYRSTIPVLDFVVPFLQVGTIVAFDDWNAFFADPERGERRAWREFLERNPRLEVQPFVGNQMLQSFVVTKLPGGSAAG